MTNKEAATMLKTIRELFSVSYSPESIAALSKAIELIEQMPDEHGDLIDRDVAFDYINRLVCGGCNAETESDCEACIKNGIDEVLYFIKPTIAAERKDDE